MATPFQALVDEIRALNGAPKVTYPEGDVSHPTVEMVLRLKRGQHLPTFKQADPDSGRFPSNKLVEHVELKSDAQWVEVYRKYQTLPGPLIWKPGWNDELGAETSTYRQRVELPATRDTVGAYINNPEGTSQLVVKSEVEPGDSVIVGTRVTECITMPPSRTERRSIGFQFPAKFHFYGGWLFNTGFRTPPPYAGVHFELTAHRTLSTPAEDSITYSNGPTGLSGVIVWRVDTPGIADQFFRIRDNTIHNAIFLQEVQGFGTQTIEDLPASTPSSYTPGQTLVIQANERRVMGTLWEQRITTCAE